MLRKFVFILVLTCYSALNLAAQDGVLGKWVTIDDETGKRKSLVEIYKQGDEVFGKIIELYNPSTPNPVCGKCSDDRADQPIMNMQIIRHMKLKDDGTTWGNGKILDPEKGREYGCTLWVEDGDLKVKGWIGFLSRTQTWVRQ